MGTGQSHPVASVVRSDSATRVLETGNSATVGIHSSASRGWYGSSFQNREASGAVGFDGIDPVGSTRTELEDLTRFALTEVLPLELERARASGDLARALYQVLKAMRADPKLRRRVPRGIEDCIVELVREGLRIDLRDPHPDLRKIHEELTGASIESRRKDEFSFMRGQMEAEFRARGIDVDLWDFDVNLPPDQAAERLARCNAMLSAQVKELKQELQGLPSDPRYGPASSVAHPVFGFEMFDRKVPLKALRAEIDQRLKWAREITEGTDPEQVLAQVFALDFFAELLDTEIDEVILKEMEPAPSPRRRKR
jgi:hypothetical protein